MRGTKDVLKMFPTIFQLLLGFLVVDYFVFLWDNTAYFSTWRDNVNAEKVRRTVDTWFGDDGTNLGRYLMVFFVYAIATYIATIKYGNSAWTLSGPISVLTFATIVQLILRFTNKYNGNFSPNGTYCNSSDTSVGCRSWNWISTLTDLFLNQYEYSDMFTGIVLGISVGFLSVYLYNL